MEFILFRIFHLLKREFETMDSLSRCLLQQRQMIALGNISAPLLLIETERELINEICMIERDRQEEMQAFARKAGVQEPNYTLLTLLESIQSDDDICTALLTGIKREIKGWMQKPRKADLKKRTGYAPKIHRHPRYNDFKRPFPLQKTETRLQRVGPIKIIDAGIL